MSRIGHPKVLIVLMGFSLDDSNAQTTRVTAIFHELIKNNFEVYCALKYDENHNPDNNFITVKPLCPIKGKFYIISQIIYRFQLTAYLIKVINQKKINNVIIRGCDSILLFLYLKLINVKIFFDFHGSFDIESYKEGRYIEGFFVKILQLVILPNSDKIITISEGVESQIPEYKNKFIRLPNGVDIDKIRTTKKTDPHFCIPENKFIIGFLGNWEQVMKIEDICDAVYPLKDTIAIIVGEGINAAALINKYHDGEKIIFTGRKSQTEAFEILKKMDVCVIPYNKDHYMANIPNFFSNRKIYEYLALGKPIILANIPGKPDWLVEFQNCLYYESGNPLDLANKIKELSDNKNLYEQISKNNYSLANKYSWDRIIDESGLLTQFKS